MGSALDQLRPIVARLQSARDVPTNAEGGDVVIGSGRLVVRHLAHYVAAASIARRLPTVATTMVDAGSGTGALAAWAAHQLAVSDLVLVDHDPAVRHVAASAWPDAGVCASLDEVPRATAGVVTAMEVIEHVAPAHQATFVADLRDTVASGGALMLSTPDERGYPGGWSGYGPHIGVLDPGALHRLVADTTGWPVAVWRLVGPAFVLGPVQRLVEPVVNRAHSALARLAPHALAAARRISAQRSNAARSRAQPPAADPVAAITAGGGRQAARAGSGLLAVAVRPD